MSKFEVDENWKATMSEGKHHLKIAIAPSLGNASGKRQTERACVPSARSRGGVSMSKISPSMSDLCFHEVSHLMQYYVKKRASNSPILQFIEGVRSSAKKKRPKNDDFLGSKPSLTNEFTSRLIWCSREGGNTSFVDARVLAGIDKYYIIINDIMQILVGLHSLRRNQICLDFILFSEKLRKLGFAHYNGKVSIVDFTKELGID